MLDNMVGIRCIESIRIGGDSRLYIKQFRLLRAKLKSHYHTTGEGILLFITSEYCCSEDF